MDIKQLKQSTDIGRVIGRYVTLHTKGDKATGLCPFHDDHHPSLTVDLRKQTFTCYACGAHGDVFGFIRQIEKVSFTEAVKQLTVDNGQLTIEKKNKRKEAKPNCQLSTVTFQLKNEGFLRSLMPYIPPHPELTDTYLAFETGISPVRVPDAFKAMSGRIIFPIRDDEGRLTGFAGRSQLKIENGKLKTEETTNHFQLSTFNFQLSKYVNTSSAEGYNKSFTLYGLFRAKEAILRSGAVYITEGYKDALAMHAAGITNTVALGGTALTDGQVGLLKKYGAEKAFLFLDGDTPGREAARKIAGHLSDERIDTLCIPLEDGQDPDSLFRETGSRAFAGYVQAASRPQVQLRNGNPLSNETALQETIKDLVRQYRHTHDLRLREDLLHTLYHRLDQYTLLSQELNRTGAV